MDVRSLGLEKICRPRFKALELALKTGRIPRSQPLGVANRARQSPLSVPSSLGAKVEAVVRSDVELRVNVASDRI